MNVSAVLVNSEHLPFYITGPGETDIKEITDLAGSATVYVSSNDRALLASRLINWALRLTGDEIPKSRELYFLETPEGVRYFVLTRGR